MYAIRRAPKPFSDVPADCVSYPERRQQIREISTLPRPALLQWMQAQPVLSRHAQHRLQAHPHIRVRHVLAMHPHLVCEVQLLLSHEPGQYLRRSLAENPGLDPRVARLLYQDIGDPHALAHWHYVVETLAGNPVTPREILWEIHALDEERLNNGRRRRLARLMGNPSFPLSAFEPLEGLDRFEQFALAQRPGLPLAELRRLQAKNVEHGVLKRTLPDPELAVVATWVQGSWEGTLGTLLDMLEIELSLLSPAARETALKLFPGWGGDWRSLLQAARELTT